MSLRWRLAFDAIDPKDASKRWEVGIHERDLDRLRRYGHDKQLARLILVEEVLQRSTLRLIAGWSRPGKADCYVYVGKPKRDLKSLSIETPAPQRMVFLVFVMEDGTIDDWTWRTQKGESDEPVGVTGKTIWELPPQT